MPDHIHCLFLLSREKSIAEVIKQIKGSSSHYINQANLISEKFSWQTGYAAFSVSESIVDKVFHYIKNQKQHHTKKKFQQEYEEFIELNGLNQSPINIVTASTVYDSTLAAFDLSGYNATLTWTFRNTGPHTGPFTGSNNS